MKSFLRCSLPALTLFFCLPLCALDVSSVKQSPLVKRGRSWEQTLEFEAQSKPGAKMVLRADRGSVVIHPGVGDDVHCRIVLQVYTPDEAAARDLLKKFELSARSAEAGSVYLTTQTPSGTRTESNLRVEFQLSVPARFNLDVESQGGDIAVDAPLDGEARLTTAGGDVRASAISGPARIETAGGRIEIADVGGDLTARTAGGSIHVGDVRGDAVLETSGGEIVTGKIAGGLRAETAGGDIEVGGAEGPLTARTAGGQIQIGPTGGTVLAETAGGSIRLRGARGRVVAETAGGSIDLFEIEGTVKATTAVGRILAEMSCAKRSCGDSRLESSMGDVLVYVRGNAPLTIDAAITAASGRRIFSDFPLNIEGDQDRVDPSVLRGSGNLNGGGEVLKIRTIAGNIEIRRADAFTLKNLQREENGEARNRKGGKVQRWQAMVGGDNE